MFMVGIAQLVSAPDCGSGGVGSNPIIHPFVLLITGLLDFLKDNELSPSGKARTLTAAFAG